MRLFNEKSLFKMIKPDAYELALNKIGDLFLNVAGEVKLRGDRYLYHDIPVIVFEQYGGACLVFFYNPFVRTEISLDQLQLDEFKVDEIYFRLGDKCTDTLSKIQEHLAFINRMHVKRPLTLQ